MPNDLAGDVRSGFQANNPHRENRESIMPWDECGISRWIGYHQAICAGTRTSLLLPGLKMTGGSEPTRAPAALKRP